MDSNNIKNQTLVETIHKTVSLARQDVLGIKSKYCWDEVILKYNMIELLEDTEAVLATQNCATQFLNSTMDTKVVAQYQSTITNQYIPIPEQSYRGEIANAAQMALVNSQSKQPGWWWSITGNFDYSGDSYVTGDEIYWNTSGFHFYGGAGSGGSSTFEPTTCETGVLVSGEPKIVNHTLGRRPYMWQAFNVDGKVELIDIVVNPLDVNGSIIVTVEEGTSDGYTISLI